jgi:hypothetical protein
LRSRIGVSSATVADAEPSEETEMTLVPKEAKDLVLAPVAAAIDLNLRYLRDRSPEEIEYELILELNVRPSTSPEERAARVLEAALRNVDLHGWGAEITDDRARVRISGGSVSLDLGLSASLLRYLTEGATKAAEPA